MSLEIRRTFPPVPSSVREARQFVTESLADTGVDAWAARLLVSELATNAVVHANTDYEVRIGSRDATVRIEVVNDAPEFVVAAREPSEDSGRGIATVDAVASDWGTDIQPDKKVVWFELPC